MQHRPFTAAARGAVTLVLLFGTVLAAGASIHAGGTGGFVFALALVAGLTYVLCRLNPDHPLAFACAAATCVALSLRVDDSRMYSRLRSIQWQYVLRPSDEALFVWGYCLLASLAIAVPFYVRRQKA
jgi:hypothetical protein